MMHLKRRESRREVVSPSLNLGAPLSTLTTSPCQTFAAVAGRDVLKVISLKIDVLKENRNLWGVSSSSNKNLATNDIYWHPGHQHKHLLASAATNGSVVIWNLDIGGKTSQSAQESVLKGHRRAVNRVSWHPSDPNALMSASQDGTIR
jgi:WD40 repeat protein